MKLHYAGSHADWDTVAPDERNAWQRLAARSNGVLTLGNIVSVVGLALVLAGLFIMSSGAFWLGLGFVIVGRVADVLDGTIADRTGTKGPIGEALDAGFDKIAAIAVLVCFVYHDWLPVIPVICVALQVAASGLLGLTAHVRSVVLHVSGTGKIATVFAWAILFIFASISTIDHAASHTLYLVLMVAGYILTIIFMALTTIATIGYFKESTVGLQRPLLSMTVTSVTSIRILCAVTAIVAANYGRWSLLFPLAIIAFASDYFDGWLARHWRVVSTFGMAFDPLADKVICLTLLALAGVYVQSWYWLLFIIFAVYDVFTMTMRFALTTPMPASKIAKLKTALLMIGLLAMTVGVHRALLAWSAAVILSAAAILTVRSLVGYMRAIGRSLTWLEYASGVATIDFIRWHEDYGVRALLLDIDGTIAPWNVVQVDDAVKTALQYARKSGITHVGLVSNMSPRHAERLMAVVKQVEASTYHVPNNRHERKPSPVMIHAALKKIDALPEEAGFIGDKLIDVLAARRAGIVRVAWVERLGSADHPLDRLLYRPVERIIKRIIR